MCRKVQIDTSGDKAIRPIFNVFSVYPRNAVCGLRLTVWNVWAKEVN